MASLIYSLLSEVNHNGWYGYSICNKFNTANSFTSGLTLILFVKLMTFCQYLLIPARNNSMISTSFGVVQRCHWNCLLSKWGLCMDSKTYQKQIHAHDHTWQHDSFFVLLLWLMDWSLSTDSFCMEYDSMVLVIIWIWRWSQLFARKKGVIMVHYFLLHCGREMVCFLLAPNVSMILAWGIDKASWWIDNIF